MRPPPVAGDEAVEQAYIDARECFGGPRGDGALGGTWRSAGDALSDPTSAGKVRVPHRRRIGGAPPAGGVWTGADWSE